MTRRMTYPGAVIGIQARGLAGQKPPHATVRPPEVEESLMIQTGTVGAGGGPLTVSRSRAPKAPLLGKYRFAARGWLKAGAYGGSFRFPQPIFFLARHQEF